MDSKPKPKTEKLNEIWAIDMSKIKTETGGVQVVIILEKNRYTAPDEEKKRWSGTNETQEMGQQNKSPSSS